jgi:hypothetical protein
MPEREPEPHGPGNPQAAPRHRQVVQQSHPVSRSRAGNDVSTGASTRLSPHAA